MPAPFPKQLLQITGVIPFAQTIFLWQSGVMLAVLMTVSTVISYLSAPTGSRAVTAQMMGVDVATKIAPLPPRERPGEWLEYSPLLTLLLVALGGGWLAQEFATKDPILAISNLNTYNFLLLMLGLLLHWRLKSFLNAATKAVPATAGILMQFPLYGGITMILTAAAGGGGPYARAAPRAVFREHQLARIISGCDGPLFGRARLLHPVRRRQMGAGGALCDAGGQ